jgi:dTDP-4-dehydrorhamnose reductase
MENTTTATNAVQVKWNIYCPTSPAHLAAYQNEIIAGEIEAGARSRVVRVEGNDPYEICEEIFKQTNLYDGEIWEALHPLPARRSHTALSVGDVIIINGDRYICRDMGFELLAQGQAEETGTDLYVIL